MDSNPKVILCFGDSNTYGYNPVDGSRYGINQRWPGVLRNELGEGNWVIEEGQPGRTTVWYDPIESVESAKEYIVPCLKSHAPIDLIILLLGTNDLKARFSLTPADIALGMQTLIKMILNNQVGPGKKPPQILLVSPPPVIEFPGSWEPMVGAQAKSERLENEYQNIASEMGCHFLNAGSVICSSRVDGIHWDVDEHFKLGQTIAALVRQILIGSFQN